MERPWFQFYDDGVPRTLDLPIPADITIPDFIQKTAQAYPTVTATVFLGARLTYQQLYEKTQRLASVLHQHGVTKGDRVAIILPNCPQTIMAYYAVLSLGGVTVLTNPLYVERELTHLWGDAGVNLVITLDLFFPKVQSTCEKLGIEKIIVTGAQDYAPFLKRMLIPLEIRRQGKWVEIPYQENRILAFRRLVERQQPAPPKVALSQADLACLQYTGGTTGLPKGAMLSHKNLVASVTQVQHFLLQDSQLARDKAIAIMPLFHVYGMNAVMNLGVLIAATIILLPRLEIKELVEAIETEKPTFFLGVPALYSAILNHSNIDNIDLTSIELCFSGGAPLPVAVIEEFERRTNAPIAEAYGLTEASSVTHVNPRRGNRKIGSVGIPIVGTDAKVVDVDNGQTELGPGQPGELLVKGPQIMEGYWNAPDETAGALKDGWLHTGDVVEMDEDGYFSVVDRKKDIIITGGFNVLPREVEEVLHQHPKVEMAAVIGLPNKVRGERVAAYIKLRPNETATKGEIRDFCKERLADFKRPRTIVFCDELPLSLIGKVLRRELREQEISKMQAKRAA